MAARIIWRLVPSFIVLLAVVRDGWLIATFHVLCLVLLRAFHVIALVFGSITFWWVLRSYQLQREQEIYERVMQRHQYYQKYSRLRPSREKKSDEVVRTKQRLPLITHLRTTWSLPLEICEEIATFSTMAVHEYIAYWFQPISMNEDFPTDAKYIVADMYGSMVARILEMDSSKALTIVSKSIELFHLHLEWFRETYASLSDEYPDVFQGEQNDEHLHRRQQLVAQYAQTLPFLHPGCTLLSSTAGKSSHDTSEVLYLRHLATQILLQLKPDIGQLYDTNVFVSMALHFMRENLVFKALKPTFEYTQPRYANEVVISCLQSMLSEKQEVIGPLSPTTTAPSTISMGLNLGLSGIANSLPNLPAELTGGKKLELTKSFLYKASKRSTEHAEAAFMAVVDAVSNVAGVVSSDRTGQEETSTGAPVLSDSDEGWPSDTQESSLSIPCDATPSISLFTPVQSPPPSSKIHFPGLSFTKASRQVPTPKHTSNSASKQVPIRTVPDETTTSIYSTPIEDLKNMKANIESSFNSSLFKVKKKIFDLGNVGGTPSSTNTGSHTATKMMKQPGRLLQKAWRRGDSSNSPNSTSTLNLSPNPSPPITPNPSPTVTPNPSPLAKNSGVFSLSTTESTELSIHERILSTLSKTVTMYIKMYHDRPEMRSSARSRELYELLSALEDVFMSGFRQPSLSDEDVQTLEQELSQSESSRILSDSLTTSTNEKNDDNIEYFYWNYMAQDRPETPFLNEHVQFIISSCPQCVENESFCSTRGIQWILLALERGTLWEFMTALHLNKRWTDVYYTDTALLRHGKAHENLLKMLFPLSKIRIVFEIPLVLGRTVDDPFRVLSRQSQCSSQIVRIIESVWEVERYVPIHGWTKTHDKRWHELPSSEWVWETEWMLESNGGPIATGSDSSDSEASGSNTSGWQYAKTFDDRFHEKEKKFDSVRRRKWIRRRRQLSPVLVLTPIVEPNPVQRSSLGARSSDASESLLTDISRTETRQSEHRKPTKTVVRRRWDDLDAALRLRKNASGKPMVKRRSLSSDAADVKTMAQFAQEGSPSSFKSGISRKLKRRSSGSLTKEVSELSRSGSKRVLESRLTVSDDEESIASSYPSGYIEEESSTYCYRCYEPLCDVTNRSFNSRVDTCHSCHQRVCTSCLSYMAFLVYPPPLETSGKEQVCGACYERLVGRYKLKVDAHVGKYFVIHRTSINDDGTLLNDPIRRTSGSSTTNTIVDDGQRYEITVQIKEESVYAWSVLKTYHDFEVFEKLLLEKVRKQEKKHGYHYKGVDYMEWARLYRDKSLKQKNLPLSYEKRLYILEDFVQQILNCDTLCQSSLVQKFFQFGRHSDHSRVLMVENGKWKKGKWIAPETNTKQTKMKVLQTLEMSLYAVLNEVFELDGIGMVRRHLFSMTRSFIKAFLNPSHFRRLEKQYMTFTDPKKMMTHLIAFRFYMFPDSLPSLPLPLTSIEMQLLRKQCLDTILSSFPSTFVSVFGETSCENAALKLHEFLQHEIFVKNLAFSICDEILPHLFPDMIPYVPPSKPSQPRVSRI